MLFKLRVLFLQFDAWFCGQAHPTTVDAIFSRRLWIEEIVSTFWRFDRWFAGEDRTYKNMLFFPYMSYSLQMFQTQFYDSTLLPVSAFETPSSVPHYGASKLKEVFNLMLMQDRLRKSLAEQARFFLRNFGLGLG